jgi:hypothetical protein
VLPRAQDLPHDGDGDQAVVLWWAASEIDARRWRSEREWTMGGARRVSDRGVVKPSAHD